MYRTSSAHPEGQLQEFTHWPWLLRWIGIALWSGILIIGLWPFNFFPRNRTSWMEAGNGLHFDAYGQAYSTTSWILNEPSEAGDLSFSIELWLRTETRHPQESPFFSIHGASGNEDLSIAQSGSDLVLRAHFRDRNGTQQRQLRLYDVCRDSEYIFVTVTSNQRGTVLYSDAKSQQPQGYPLFPERYFGFLLLGHAPDGSAHWTGDMLGMGVYGHALAGDEIAQHYADWLQHKPQLLQGARALYTFDERAGDVIHNRAGSAPDLIIPAIFKPLHPRVLAVPHPFRLHRIDTVINILGFIPLGFFLCAYLQDVKHFAERNALVSAIILGTLTSLGIELLQVFLPSRDSSLLDVINNAAGTIMGAFLQLRVHDYWREVICRLIPRTQVSRFQD